MIIVTFGSGQTTTSSGGVVQINNDNANTITISSYNPKNVPI